MTAGRWLLSLLRDLEGLLTPPAGTPGPLAALAPGIPRCGVCGQRVTLRHLVSPHGEPFCLHHQGQEALCCGCGHAVRQPTPVPGVCGACRGDLLSTEARAAQLVQRVQGDLRRLGLPWWPQAFPVRLLAPEEMRRQQAGGTAPAAGLIKWRMTCDPQGRVSRTVDQISLLMHRPSLLQGSILAHELGHAWLLHQGLTGWPADLEEGFCNFLGHTWLASTGDPRAAHLMRQLEVDPDPVYGGGFRRVRDLAGSRGIPGAVAGLPALAGPARPPGSAPNLPWAARP